jgi:hypothetical protein
MRRSTFGILAAGLALLTATAGALVFPASVQAKTQETIVVHPNQEVKVTKPGLPGVAYAYGRSADVGGYDPDHCGDCGTGEAFCEYFPIRLDLSDAQLRNNVYLVLFVLDWPGENVSVPAVITAANPQLKLAIWEDPIVPDEEPAPPCDDPQLADGVPDPAGLTCPAAPDEKPGGDEPLFETGLGDPKPLRFGMLVDAKHTKLSAVIANYAGNNDKYTLSVELVQIEGTPDLSVDESITDLSAIDQSVDRPGSPSSFSGFDPGAASGGLAPSLGLADLGADSTLDSLGIQGDAALGFDDDTARLLASRNIRDIRPPGDEAGWALILWLVVVPVAIAGGAVAWALRRRATLLSDI